MSRYPEDPSEDPNEWSVRIISEGRSSPEKKRKIEKSHGIFVAYIESDDFLRDEQEYTLRIEIEKNVLKNKWSSKLGGGMFHIKIENMDSVKLTKGEERNKEFSIGDDTGVDFRIKAISPGSGSIETEMLFQTGGHFAYLGKIKLDFEIKSA